MIRLAAAISTLLALIPFTTAQAPEWAQCGGSGWTGDTVSTTLVLHPAYL
ncbi:hypothetical protein AN958_07119 [Leucoagaricus sp. SymC.cos]|nr:hypothetical protein AN958_07119 [Leucoagaricus sp. SymC.cos]